MRHRTSHILGRDSTDPPAVATTHDVGQTRTADPGSRTPEQGAAALFTWGPLRVLARLGQGAFGDVYRAYDPTLQREVALKLGRHSTPEDDPAGDRFLEEARRLARVRHPNVLVVHGADRHDGRAGIWTDLLEGETLETLLQQQGPFSAHEAALIGLDLCRALAATHAAGLVHRDVKTSNVMRERGGRIVLMDFGSGGQSPSEGETRVTQHLHGTPIAMAPEQLRGEIAGPATDIYGLGVLLYRLVTGAFPVEGDSIALLAEKHARRERTPLRDRRPDLPADFAQVIERAIETDPAGRYASAGALEQALLAVAAGATGPRTRRHAGRRRLVAVAGLAGIVAVAAAGLAWYLAHRPPGPRDRAIRGSPTAPPVARTPPSEPARALTAAVNLYRHSREGRARVLDGARITPGDRLSMAVEGSMEMYVYVLNEDEQGQCFVLFPVPGMDLQNPLPPGDRHDLPGRLQGRPMTWEVTSIGGREDIVVIASRQPLADLERDLRLFPRAVPGAPLEYGKLSARAREELRGIGRVASDPLPQGEKVPRLADALARLSTDGDSTGGVWVWQTRLENPAR